MAKTLKELSFLDLAPSSITGDSKVQGIIKAADPELHRVVDNIEKVLILPRLDELPENVLDLLAWQWHVDFYELARSIEAKRDFIRTSILWHRKKGTVWAILKALDMLGIKGTFTPWWELKDDEGNVIGEPYTFALDAELTDEYWNRADWNDPAGVIRRTIVESKAKRSWMENLYIHRDSQSRLDIISATATAQGIHHDIDMALHLGGTADTLSLAAVMATVRRGTHDIAMRQHTEGTGHSEFVSATATAQESRHAVNLAQHTEGASRAKVLVSMRLAQKNTLEIGLKRHAAVGIGTISIITPVHAARQQIGLRQVSARKIPLACKYAVSCGIRMGIGAA